LEKRAADGEDEDDLRDDAELKRRADVEDDARFCCWRT
jgi:hypothetical protein